MKAGLCINKMQNNKSKPRGHLGANIWMKRSILNNCQKCNIEETWCTSTERGFIVRWNNWQKITNDGYCHALRNFSVIHTVCRVTRITKPTQGKATNILHLAKTEVLCLSTAFFFIGLMFFCVHQLFWVGQGLNDFL